MLYNSRQTLHQINTLVITALRKEFDIDDISTYLEVINRLAETELAKVEKSIEE